MIATENRNEYYQALLDKNTEYEGVFYVGVKTTGVFCRPTCPARKPKSAIIPGDTQPIHSIESELRQYFDGELSEFRTPLHFLGSPFQQRVWNELKKIPFGETRSYADMAKTIGKPSAFLAVAQANGANQLGVARISYGPGPYCQVMEALKEAGRKALVLQ